MCCPAEHCPTLFIPVRCQSSSNTLNHRQHHDFATISDGCQYGLLTMIIEILPKPYSAPEVYYYFFAPADNLFTPKLLMRHTIGKQ
jgi:hypothetical protein